MKKLLIYITIFLIAGACSKDEENTKTSGEVTLTSQLILSGNTYVVEGFILEQAKKVNYNQTSTPYPDLVMENVINTSGTVEGANLASPQNEEAFFKVGDYGSLNEAENAFNALTEAGSYTYSQTAPNIKANQVYVFKTRADRFAKLLIKDYQIIPSTVKNYVQITIRWVYQPNGEKTFPTSK